MYDVINTILSKQELKILKLFALNLNDRDIAEKLNLTEYTVKRCTKNIVNRLLAKDKEQAVQRAIGLDLV